MIHSQMVKNRDVECILGLEAVFVDNTDRNHLFLDYRQNDLGLSIWNDGDVDLVFLLEQRPKTATLPSAHYGLFMLCPFLRNNSHLPRLQQTIQNKAAC